MKTVRAKNLGNDQSKQLTKIVRPEDLGTNVRIVKAVKVNTEKRS